MKGQREKEKESRCKESKKTEGKERKKKLSN